MNATRGVVAAVCYAVVGLLFLVSAAVLGRDGASTQAVIMGIGAIAFVTVSVVTTLTANDREPPRR